MGSDAPGSAHRPRVEMAGRSVTVHGTWWHPLDGLPRALDSHTYFPAGPTSTLASSLVASGGLIAELTARPIALGLLFAGGSRVRAASFDRRTGMEFSTGPRMDWHRVLQKARRSRGLMSARKARVMVQRASYNYHHFLLEIATSALRWQDAGELDAEADLLVASTPFGREVLRLAGIGGRVRQVPRNSVVLLASSTILQAVPAGFLDTDAIRRVADRVTAAVAPPRGGGRIVYLARPPSQRRTLSNESDVLRVLRAEFGDIDVVDPGALSVADQARRVAGARVIIGPHGAQLTNLIWARDLEVLVELLPYHLSDYRSLAATLGVRYVAVRGSGYERPDHEAAFSCSPGAVAEAVRGII